VVEYRVLTQEEWDGIPPLASKKPDAFAHILGDLERGHIVEVAYTDDKDRRSKRVSIARRASSHGFKVEARVTEHSIAFRRADAPASQAGKPRTRRRKASE